MAVFTIQMNNSTFPGWRKAEFLTVDRVCEWPLWWCGINLNNMSKAFTRESDDLPESPLVARLPSHLPPGAKNYLTPGGAERMREELDRLTHVERPKTASEANLGKPDRNVQALEQRIRQLEQSLQTAEIVVPPSMPWDQVRFGATVTVRDRAGNESQYRIVGVDETDLDRGWVSWLSPVARALLKARLGERVRFHFPAGEEQLEIANITYE